MLNNRIAGRYAKSLLGLAVEKDQLERVYDDMKYMKKLCDESPEFRNLLRSPVIKADKKYAILQTLTTGKISELTESFNKLLIYKSREAGLPEIIHAFIDQYKALKNIHTIRLTTASPVSDSVKQQIVDKVKQEANLEHVEVESRVDEDLIGGFVLQLGDTLVDASVAYDLNKIKSQFQNNDFIYNIR